MEEYIKNIEAAGYCKLTQVYSPDQVANALKLVREWYEKTKDKLSSNLPYLAKNDPFVWNPQNKDYYFLEMLFGKPEIERILIHFLNDKWFKQIPSMEPNYILRSYLARSSNQVLPMHIDSLVPYGGPHAFVMQAVIALEDISESNGCTVVVPGSHMSCEYADQGAFDTGVPLEMKAGDVVIWDSRMWHGARENRTAGTRWALVATFSRWWIKQMFNITGSLPQDIYVRLTNKEKAILGFCSVAYNDEFRGVDMKRGYESLLQNVSEYRV